VRDLSQLRILAQQEYAPALVTTEKNPEKPGEIRFIEHWNASVEWFMNVSASELVDRVEVLTAA
jgi:hypothetical protein